MVSGGDLHDVARVRSINHQDGELSRATDVGVWKAFRERTAKRRRAHLEVG